MIGERQSNEVFPRSDGYSLVRFSELPNCPKDSQVVVVALDPIALPNADPKILENRIMVVGTVGELTYDYTLPSPRLSQAHIASTLSAHQIRETSYLGWRRTVARPFGLDVDSETFRLPKGVPLDDAFTDEGITFFVSPPLATSNTREP